MEYFEIWWYLGMIPDESISLGYNNLASQPFRSIIPWRVNRSGVWYPGESIVPEYDTLASQSPWGMIPRRFDVKICVDISPVFIPPASQSPWGTILRWVTAISYPGDGESISHRVCEPGESLMTPGSQQPFKGTVSIIVLFILILLIIGYILQFWKKFQDSNFFDSQGYDTPASGESVFSSLKFK